MQLPALFRPLWIPTAARRCFWARCSAGSGLRCSCLAVWRSEVMVVLKGVRLKKKKSTSVLFLECVWRWGEAAKGAACSPKTTLRKVILNCRCFSYCNSHIVTGFASVIKATNWQNTMLIVKTFFGFLLTQTRKTWLWIVLCLKPSAWAVPNTCASLPVRIITAFSYSRSYPWLEQWLAFFKVHQTLFINLL